MLVELPRWLAPFLGGWLVVCVCCLRTQQGACLKASAKLASFDSPVREIIFGNFCCRDNCVQQVFVGEFDPGSGRTLAACLTHASRAERPFGVLERRTGE